MEQPGQMVHLEAMEEMDLPATQMNNFRQAEQVDWEVE
jgi:hypothetical protein